jgi:hypothetical protein
MSCEAEIDALATAVDNWTATTQASQAIKAQRDQMDSAAMTTMYEAYWSLYQCQYGGMLRQTSPLPESISEASTEQMIEFLDHCKTMKKNRTK